MLNPALKKFLKRQNGSFLVLGPPGTGKTYQLTRLVGHLIVSEKIKPQRILVFCFNRRWAKILREVTSELVNGSILEISITTFFAYCTEVIKKIQFSNLPPRDMSSDNEFRILNAPEQWLLLRKTITDDLDINSYPVTFSHILHENKNIVSSYVQEVFDFILRAQENLVRPSDLPDLFGKNITPVLYEISGIYASYKKKLIDENLYNYGRLLEDTVDFFQKESDARKIMQKSYDYIIVDDFQEVNKAQYEIIKAISRDNCIYFGNDDQCTYAFRGSALDIFNEVHKSLEQNSGDKKNILLLKHNYRSNSKINKISELFISKNIYRIPKNSRADRSHRGSVTLKEFRNTIDEANFIAGCINDLISGKDIKPEEILVLVKGRGYKTRLLENILESNNIAFFQRSSRAMLDNPHIMYILNFIKLINLLKPYFRYRNRSGYVKTPSEEKSKTIDIAYEAIIYSDFVGIDPTSIVKQIAGTKDIWKKLEAVPPVYEAVADFIEMDAINAFKVIMRFLNDKKIGIFRYLADKNTLSEGERGTVLSLIGDFLYTVRDFVEKNPGANTISDYLYFLEDAMTNNFLEEIEDSTKEFVRPGFVNIMSFHQCRGLEFDAVFVPFINKNYLPAEFGKTQLYDMETFNYFSGGKKVSAELLRKKHFEDERKLFYTGLTRAKKFLFVSSNTQENRSVFFEELKTIKDTLPERDTRVKNIQGTIKKVKGGGGPEYSKLEGINIYSGKSWLLRKSMIARSFKYARNLSLEKKKFERDLLELLISYPYTSWWRTRKVTENRNNPHNIYCPSYSYSSLNTFKECPFKYKMRYFFNIAEEEDLAVKVGSLYHRALKSFFDDPEKDYSWENLKNVVISIFSSGRYVFEFNYLKDEVFQKALRDFKRFHEYFVQGKDFDVLSEREFNFKIDDDLIKGRIDHINLAGDTKAQLVDFKSGNKNSSPGYAEEEIQLRLYRLAIDLCSELDFIKGRDILLKYIFIGEEKSRDPAALLPDNLYDQGEFIRYLKSIIKRIKGQHFVAEPENYYLCRFCSYRMLCPNRNA